MTPEQLATACVRHMLDHDPASRNLGLEIVSVAPGHVALRMHVTTDMTNGFDVCHGGLLFALADSTLAFAANTYDEVAMVSSADVEFLRTATRGEVLTASAVERNRGRRNSLYDVTITNAAGETLALVRGRCTRLGRTLLPPRQ